MTDTTSGSERRRRSRKASFQIDEQLVVDRVLKFFDDDDTNRSAEKEARVQRYAKFRMWTEGKDWPWDDASDVPLADMMEKSQHLQDTIHNAFMSTRPALNAKSNDRMDKAKEPLVDQLIDHQVFIEQDGEDRIGEFADAFINDGVAFVFVPWIRDFQKLSEVRTFPPIPDDLLATEYFATILEEQFPGAGIAAISDAGWDWDVIDAAGEQFEAQFFTDRDDRVEMVRQREVQIYDGPRLIQKEWDEVLFPARAANLQRPSPSNPHGAGHVILVDYPTVDEIVGLQQRGFYDRLTKADLDALTVSSRDTTRNEEMRRQKDVMQGVVDEGSNDDKRVPEQRTVTRLTCFDIMDVDGDGLAEDVVWRVIKDTKTLARAALLTEDFPSSDGRRPIEHQAFLPIRGRVAGIGLLEMIEGLHDIIKTILDQTIDSGTVKNSPFGFYRPSGTMKPEIIRLAPGELYPLNDPQRDINFPRMGNEDQSFGINMISMLSQMEDRETTIGPLQLGRVPPGGSSALRTVGGMSLIAGQGEARPERILRRWFKLWSRVWRRIHDLNRIHLREEKRIRLIGLKDAGEDPYRTITPADINSLFEFDFTANVLNTSKAGLQQAMQALMATYINPLYIQLGILRPDGAYRLGRDFGFAQGQDPDQYLTPPDPEASLPGITAEEAIAAIIEGEFPRGRPGEPGGAAEHLSKLQEFQASDEFGLFTEPAQLEAFATYVQQTTQRAIVEQQQAAQVQAAAGFGQQQQGQPGRPAEQPPQAPGGPPPVQNGELIDESLPGAGGGANAA